MGQNITKAAVTTGYLIKIAHVQGSRLLRNVKVISKIEDRLRDHRERCSITVDSLTAELEKARLLAMRTHKPAAAVRAIVAKARLHPFICEGGNPPRLTTSILTHFRLTSQYD